MADETDMNRDARRILRATPSSELFPGDFMQAYTLLHSFAELLDAGGYDKAEDLLCDEATRFVKQKQSLAALHTWLAGR